MSDDIRQGWTSASSAPADALCPGRHLAQRGIPEPEKGPDAAGGQLIHACLANSSDVSLMSKMTVEQRGTFDACREIERKLVLEYFGKATEPMRVFRERRHWVKIKGNIEGSPVLEHSGMADVIFRSGTRLLIADYKTLMGDVEDSPKNLQLRDLAVLAWGALRPITEVATAIIQPFVTHKPELCIYTTEDLEKAELEMNKRVSASNHPDSPRIPGSPQCDFCLARATCLEYQGWASAITPPELSSLMQTRIADWSPAQRAKAAEALGPAFDLLESIKQWFKEGLEKDPNFIPGWGLKKGATREIITNPQECYDRFNKLGGTLEQFMTCISVGKTKLSEHISTITGQTGIALEKTMKGLTDGIVEFKENAPSLKKLKD